MGECALSEGDRPLLAIPGIVEFERNAGKVSFAGADMGELPWDGPPWDIPRCCCCCIANACCGFMRFGAFMFMFPPEFRICCCISMSCRCWFKFMALMFPGICWLKLLAAMRGSTMGGLWAWLLNGYMPACWDWALICCWDWDATGDCWPRGDMGLGPPLCMGALGMGGFWPRPGI